MDKKEDAQSSSSAGETPANILANPSILQNIQQRLDSMGEDAGGFFGEGYVTLHRFFLFPFFVRDKMSYKTILSPSFPDKYIVLFPSIRVYCVIILIVFIDQVNVKY